MNAKQLSIVTIAYNNLGGLRRTCASVLGQTWLDFEWIVIDGGSTDGSRDYLSALEPQPDYWVSEKDNGIYDAINKGIAHASGRYVMCMNSGDVFRDPHVLENVFSKFPGTDVVYGDWVMTYPDGREEFHASPREFRRDYFFGRNQDICHQAMFVRTDLCKRYPFSCKYRIIADRVKWREFSLRGFSFSYVPVTVCTFEGGGGISQRPGRRGKYERVLQRIDSTLLRIRLLIEKFIQR